MLEVVREATVRLIHFDRTLTKRRLTAAGRIRRAGHQIAVGYSVRCAAPFCWPMASRLRLVTCCLGQSRAARMKHDVHRLTPVFFGNRFVGTLLKTVRQGFEVYNARTIKMTG